MPPGRDDLGRIAVYIDGLARQPQAGGRLERGMHHDMLSGRNATENTACMVAQKTARRDFVPERGPLGLDTGKTIADLDTLGRIDGHHGLRDIRIQSVEHGFAEAWRHALGYGRPQLVWRALRETGLTTGAAWAISVVACLGGLLYMQFGVYAPLGLRLNLLNGTPWLFTLPIPAAVLAAATGTVARTLSRLDPVSIIERRQSA